ncbi:TetR/AcrR family transcriptional regulator [[Mycobacterium] burgundiense]|jgi:AcrR family transcriptional regulator|uniref:TetR/AcrR family transcriptional regulator n=1 Tax=[Mycobacterium] burgundiense TaxID=3064286 RepID=A0ABN9NQV0_9MYCO|nr:TetR/AcrR family transcriptional regulator [Mycolicibacterium sp. MU0053]CAJ1510536.1 TetR/AcrR family transcriptional regulator [Mycolicibacterium sp. MU0053]
MKSRVQERTSRQVLDAARAFIETHGLEQLSMRRLATEAGVSVRTLYNHFGDKDGLLTALVQRSLDSIDVAVHHLSATDPIERIWEAIAVSIDKTAAEVPKAVVRAVVMDDRLVDVVNVRWTGWDLIVSEIGAATKAGALRDDIAPELLAEHAAMVLFHLQRRWTAGELDDAGLRAGALHAFDICLLAVAQPRTRTRILEHAQSLSGQRPRLTEG